MKRFIAMYLRVSTLDQARNGYGLGDQEVQCKKYIDLYYPEDDVEIYKDDGYSAKNLERPEMARMLEDMKSGKIHTIITFKLDRLTRNVVDTYKLIKQVMAYDCSLVAVVDRLDITSANGRMFVGLLSLISQWEREVISERTIAGLEQMARSGKYPCGGKTPYGWDKTDDGKLVINENEAEIINYMTDCYIEGYSLQDISKMVFTKYEYRKSWRHLKELLIRKMNIGIFEFHGVSYDDFVPPIMNLNKYNELLKMAAHREVHSLDKQTYTFHHLVYCSCGKMMQHVCTIKHNSGVSRIYRYYYCDSCNKRVNQTFLEKEIFETLFLEEFRIKALEKHKKKEQILSSLEAKKEEVFNAYKENIIDFDTYKFTMAKLEKERNMALKELSSLDIVSNSKYFEMTQDEKYAYVHDMISKIIFDFDEQIVLSIQFKRK